ncbi:(Na+)-NQR maturation NqrM [Porticoccus sp. W117]|uniref:(Na+)-NQR maturation NqrM n=1 Tax=Porticoccus sp. W117 TaxID=3054777 RepID=UPI0025937C51|nr:(Na+)-NQR maturation NqrM [Porticoccus sp. W117]MDM3869912.1 (Na+)-NQR maturation NqrM [Porticoccus sp. W117]
MLTFLLAIGLIILLIAGMAIGVIMGRKPLAGSCGGVGAALGEKDYECDLCGGDPNKCESLQNGEPDTADLSYDATKKRP